jgi:glycosyltransferase involved in cell wall biosynthesis
MSVTWIISQVFYPDETSTGYVMTKIAETLSDNQTVNVICGNADYQSKSLNASSKLNGNINIMRVNTPALDKNRLRNRLLVFVLFTWAVFFRILFKIKKGDSVVVVTNPPTLIVLVGILKKVKRFRYSIIMHDVFPENAVAAGALKADSFLYKFSLSFFNFSYRQADSLICLGKDMAERFIAKGIETSKISIIQNWADHHNIKPEPAIDRNAYFNMNLDGKVVLQFAGNIGRVQGLEEFIKLFRKAANPSLVLVIIGDGAHKKILERYVQSNNIENVFFLDSKPRAEQQTFLNSCDIGLVTVSEGMYGLGIPSKVYNIMSAGKAIFYIGDAGSEIDNYVQQNDIGWSFSWHDEQATIARLASLHPGKLITQKGETARQFVLAHFTQDIILQKYKAALQ